MTTSGNYDRFRSFALDENVPAMAAMLDAGLDVNAVNEARQTAFMHCCANDRLKSARLLASRGADIHLADHGGTTPADWAARYASREFRDWLERIGGRPHDSSQYSGL